MVLQINEKKQTWTHHKVCSPLLPYSLSATEWKSWLAAQPAILICLLFSIFCSKESIIWGQDHIRSGSYHDMTASYQDRTASYHDMAASYQDSIISGSHHIRTGSYQWLPTIPHELLWGWGDQKWGKYSTQNPSPDWDGCRNVTHIELKLKWWQLSVVINT